MPDDVSFQSTTPATPPSGTVVATDDVGGAQYQRVKPDWGGDGVSVPATGANTPLLEGTDATGATMPAGGASGRGWLSSIWKALTDRLPAALVGGRLDVNIGASGITQPVSGTVAVSNLPGTQPVSGTVTANLGTIAGVATEATLAAVDGHVDGLETAVASTNTKLDTLHTDVDGLEGLTGAVTETAPGTDTASSGLNGRLQRIAQRLTSLIALLPTSLGQKTGANSLGVVLASDQAALPLPSFTAPVSGELVGVTSATQLPNVPCKMVKLKASYDNAGRVYIGGSGVTKADGSTDTVTGLQLSAYEETGWLLVDNLNRFYRICDNVGDDLTYLAMN